MKRAKAQVLFPKSLLDEIQKYVQGELVYIPKSSANYNKWGANTSTKDVIASRNENITQAFRTGTSISGLAELYNLADDTIKKIVYGKR